MPNRTCGLQLLSPPLRSAYLKGERRLPRRCSYQPCDIAARDSRNIVCDFSLGEVPAAAEYDVVILLGVLEFGHSAEKLIAKFPKYNARSWCISYHPSDVFGMNEEVLKMRGRPLLMSEPEFLQQIEKAGHRVARRIPIGDNDMLYVTGVASSGRDSTDT